MSIGIDRTSRRADGFTLVELLVVIAVIGVLIGTLLPALGGARDRANELRDANALRQLVLAYDLYAQEHGDALIV
ncbi:MAG: type II secretion system protein, partial [Planctomycetota bacterium]